MKRRLISAFLIVALLLCLIPLNVFATNSVANVDAIYLEDGTYVEVIVETTPTRAANTVSGSKTYICRNSSGDALWQAKLSATFAYSGGWYTCTTASCTVTIYDNSWYKISESTVRSSNNATSFLTMGRKVLGVTLEKPEYTIHLTCDNNGNLS